MFTVVEYFCKGFKNGQSFKNQPGLEMGRNFKSLKSLNRIIKLNRLLIYRLILLIYQTGFKEN
jgi:hypothetical protein